MPATARALSQFAIDVAEGFLRESQKSISARYFYDELGTLLFDAITALPEYGLTRADQRLLSRHAREIALESGPVSCVAELGSGTGKKTRYLLRACGVRTEELIYRPIDISQEALASCVAELGSYAKIQPVHSDWLDGLERIALENTTDSPILLLFLGSSIGNVNRPEIGDFLTRVRSLLRKGDCFLLGADLLKDVDEMVTAYDDPTGVTAAFNLNMLGRINRELGGHFDLRAFRHEVRWDATERRIEMHLTACENQRVYIAALGESVFFRAGETIWTESSHKFTEPELDSYAQESGFETISTWIDAEWPFAETLWRAV